MKGLSRKVHIIILIAAALSSLPFTTLFASGTHQRGEFPQCQEECLKRHTEKMEKLGERYKATGNRLQYQDDVQFQSLQYETCLENCRQLYPVK